MHAKLCPTLAGFVTALAISVQGCSTDSGGGTTSGGGNNAVNPGAGNGSMQPGGGSAATQGYVLVLFDVNTRQVQMAVIHPSKLPAATAGLLPTLPRSLGRATIDALLALRLPG